MEPLGTKILCGVLVMSLSVIFGYLPVLISRKFPLLSASDPRHNKKALRNIVFSFLLNFGGGVLFANSFCHWLPEVREGKITIMCTYELLTTSYHEFPIPVLLLFFYYPINLF